MREIIRYGAAPLTPAKSKKSDQVPVRLEGPPLPIDDVKTAIRRLVKLRQSGNVTEAGRVELDAIIGALHVATLQGEP